MESKNPQDAAESKWFIFDNCRFDDINFYDIEALKEKRFITTAKNNLTVKGIPIKAGDFLGRDKAIEQVKRVLGIQERGRNAEKGRLFGSERKGRSLAFPSYRDKGCLPGRGGNAMELDGVDAGRAQLLPPAVQELGRIS